MIKLEFIDWIKKFILPNNKHNYNQYTFYFNKINVNKIENFEELNKMEWNEKIIVVNMQSFEVYFLVYNNELYIKSRKIYNSDKFKNIFNNNNDIVKIISYY